MMPKLKLYHSIAQKKFRSKLSFGKRCCWKWIMNSRDQKSDLNISFGSDNTEKGESSMAANLN